MKSQSTYTFSPKLFWSLRGLLEKEIVLAVYLGTIMSSNEQQFYSTPLGNVVVYGFDPAVCVETAYQKMRSESCKTGLHASKKLPT